MSSLVDQCLLYAESMIALVIVTSRLDLIVRSDNVEDFINESQLRQIPREELNAYIQVREDSKSILSKLFF